METITTVISNVGFPIACCIGLAMYILKRDKKHSDEIAELKKSIDNNTKAFTELLLYLKEREN